MSGAKGGMTLYLAEPGETVKIGSDKFIVMSKASTSVKLLRAILVGSTTALAAASTDCNYNGSLLDQFCTGTFKDTLPATVQSFLVPTSFTYTRVNAGTSSTVTITRDIRLPTYSELSSSAWLTALRTYHNAPSETANYARRTQNAGGTFSPYWIADGYPTGSGRWREVNNTGAFGYTGAPHTDSYGMRPLLNLNPNTPVTTDADGYVIGG